MSPKVRQVHIVREGSVRGVHTWVRGECFSGWEVQEAPSGVAGGLGVDCTKEPAFQSLAEHLRPEEPFRREEEQKQETDEV